MWVVRIIQVMSIMRMILMYTMIMITARNDDDTVTIMSMKSIKATLASWSSGCFFS